MQKIDTPALARTQTQARPRASTAHARCGQPAMTMRMPNGAESKVAVTEFSGVSSLLLGENQEADDNRETDGRRGVRFDSPRKGDSPPVRATVAGSPLSAIRGLLKSRESDGGGTDLSGEESPFPRKGANG